MQNILCEKNEQMILNQVFEDCKLLLQDSDAVEEKEKVKNSLKSGNLTCILWQLLMPF